MEVENNISGISESLSDSITEQKASAEKHAEKPSLAGRRVAISVSESEELEQLGLSDNHLKDISIEFARYLIVNGATLLYGGDLRRGGFTELFSELSYQYKYLKDREYRFVNYFPFPTSNSISLDEKATFRNKQVEVKILETPPHLSFVDAAKEYQPFDNLEDRYVIAECLTDMREKMADESDARILLGGRQTGFVGYFPGVVEEAYQSFKARKPVYLIGGFGGAAKSIISIINGDNPRELTNEFQFNSDFSKEFKQYSTNKSGVQLDYNEIVTLFQQQTVDFLSEQNGLTAEENQILFKSQNIYELVFLVIKGLQNTLDRKR